MDGLPADFWNVPYLGKPSETHGGGEVGVAVLDSLPEKEDISVIWLRLHGADDWVGLLEPLDPSLRVEIRKYGGFAQATYDAFDFDPFSKYCGSSRYDASRLLDKVGLGDKGYEVTRYLYATMTELPTPPLLERLLKHWLPKSLCKDSWSQESNWMGFVAVSNDEESGRIGRRDILVAWRGTMEPSEWYKDAQWRLEPLGSGGRKGPMVEHGFHSIYTSRSSSCEYTKSSASEQVMAEISRLVHKYHGDRKEVVSLTVTGHSLGGALVLLNAREASAASIPGLAHVSAVSFGAPRVGNAAFADELAKVGAKLLRVVIQQDIVPKVPGLLVIPGYQHAGVEKKLDASELNYSWLDLPRFHSLKTYLHLMELQRSYHPTAISSQAVAAGLSLAGMSSEMLEDVLRARSCWYRMADMGLVQGLPGWSTWSEREPEDVPKPSVDGVSADAVPPSSTS